MVPAMNSQGIPEPSAVLDQFSDKVPEAGFAELKMKKAVIAIPADTREMDGYVWHASPEQYVTAVLLAADVVPLIVPAFSDGSDGPAVIDTVLDWVDGVLVSGARSNVGPELYGETALEEHGPYDTARDATSLPLIRRSLQRAIPLLAICRGIQELNVALGGTLATEIQDEPGNLDHRRPEGPDPDIRFAIRHQVEIEPDSHLHRIFGGGTAEVNSLHRQAIGRIAPGLAIEARAEDGVIEAISVTGAAAFAVAVQWHPEYWATSDPTSRGLFEAFGNAARQYTLRRDNQAAA